MLENAFLEEALMEADTFSLNGKIALVSGAGRGIGRSIAVGLAKAGADLVVFSRTKEQFQATASEIKGLGRRALGMRVDVSKREDVANMVEMSVREFGRLDVLVNNAGLNPSYTFIERVKDKHWDQIMDVNLRGAFNCCREVIPIMKEQGRGCIINVASVAGLKALYKCAPYTASKGGLVQLTRTMAIELAPFNIRANVLAPGFVGTELTEGLLTDPEENERVLSLIPMGRTGEAHEIAPAVVFLASDAASYITGAVLCVDGGWSAW
jgi:NAD(P)-dependent dehydrogenase (short-subunit alcohol dehydrogenase family)